MIGILITLIAGPFVILALAFGWNHIGRTIHDLRACDRECCAESYRAIDRETAQAITIGGGADFLHNGDNAC